MIRVCWQVAGKDFFEARAHVVTSVSLRILLAIAAANHHFIKQYDMETAFLHADLEEEVFVEIRKEFKITQKSLWFTSGSTLLVKAPLQILCFSRIRTMFDRRISFRKKESQWQTDHYRISCR
jgi:hypothetical protein